ncbi:MAG: phenylacetate--CoA ligase family protein [Anaerolineae bacterium]|nr:phenylacetate--CoA ligase family protein [Anaerolineae bacterium]
MRRTPLDAWAAHKIGRAGSPVQRADLDAYQRHRLRATVDRARQRSRFYRHLLADAPLDAPLPDGLPFTTPGDIRADPLAFVCVSQDAIQRVVTLDSSGTTGQPKRLYFTPDDQALTVDFFGVGMSTFTDPGDRVLILLPGQTPGSVGDLLAVGLARIGAVPIQHGPVRDAAATLDVMRREKVNVLVGAPTHVLALARQPDAASVRLKSVLLSTDHVPNAIKAAIERAFTCAVYNHYGMTEMGLGGGVECAARRGYHLREADLLVEIVDPATGRVLPDGEYGEVVFSTLTREGMPLLRYRTGDVSRFLPGACPCGTALRTLERITHRLGGPIPGLTMADLDEALFALDGVLNFTATLAREDQRDVLHIAVQMAAGADPARTLRSAASALARFDSVNVHMRISQIDSIPASLAKRRISDLRCGPMKLK